MASGGLVLAGAYLAWAVRPRGMGPAHAVALALVAVLVGSAVHAWSRRGPAALAAVLVAGTTCVVALQTSALPVPVPVDRIPVAAAPVAAPPYDLGRLRAATDGYRGTVLQLASLGSATAEQMDRGELLFGNLPRATGLESVVSYTGMGFESFQQALCMDYRGIVCPQAFDRLWQPASPTVRAPLIDVLRVSTLVVQPALRPDVAAMPPPAGWHVLLRDAARTVWVRDVPLDGPGRVSWTSPGTTVTSDVSAPQLESVHVDAGAGGRIVFARLAWPGYAAAVDGRPVAVSRGPAGLLSVDLPPGRHELRVSYREPGLRAGALAAAAGGVLALLLSAWVVFAARPSRGSA